MPFRSTRRTTGRVLYLFHRWESIPVRGPPLQLDTTLSPFVFTKVMRLVVRFFRSHNGVGLPSEAISRLPRVPWRGA